MNTQEFLAILEKCRKEKKKFTDPYFRNSNDSLCRDAKEYRNSYSKFTWKRISELKAEGPLQIFDAQIEPSDIAQGALGDCYFLSTLSVLAERPNRVRKLFVDDQVNEAGIYGVWLTKNGMRH